MSHSEASWSADSHSDKDEKETQKEQHEEQQDDLPPVQLRPSRLKSHRRILWMHRRALVRSEQQQEPQQNPLDAVDVPAALRGLSMAGTPSTLAARAAAAAACAEVRPRRRIVHVARSRIRARERSAHINSMAQSYAREAVVQSTGGADLADLRNAVINVAAQEYADTLRVYAADACINASTSVENDDAPSRFPLRWPMHRQFAPRPPAYCSLKETIPASQHPRRFENNALVPQPWPQQQPCSRWQTDPVEDLRECLLAEITQTAVSETRLRPKSDLDSQPACEASIHDDQPSAVSNDNDVADETADPLQTVIDDDLELDLEEFESSEDAQAIATETSDIVFKLLNTLAALRKSSRDPPGLDRISQAGPATSESIFSSAFFCGVPENVISNARRRLWRLLGSSARPTWQPAPEFRKKRSMPLFSTVGRPKLRVPRKRGRPSKANKDDTNDDVTMDIDEETNDGSYDDDQIDTDEIASSHDIEA